MGEALCRGDADEDVVAGEDAAEPVWSPLKPNAGIGGAGGGVGGVGGVGADLFSCWGWGLPFSSTTNTAAKDV